MDWVVRETRVEEVEEVGGESMADWMEDRRGRAEKVLWVKGTEGGGRAG